VIKNITLSAEERLIKAARARAQQERTTLNGLFRQWLERYTALGTRGTNYSAIMKRLKHVSNKRRFTRDELNER
jgi:hypothetical protein